MSEAAVQQEIGLGIPSLDVLVDKLVDHLDARNYADDEIMAKVKELERAYAIYAEVRQTKKSLGALRPIAERYGISAGTLFNYHFGVIPRPIKKVMSFQDDPSTKLERKEDVTVAYLMGALFSQKYNTAINREKECAYLVGVLNPDNTREIMRCCEKLGIPATANGPNIRMQFCRALKYIDDAISDKIVPWEHLVTLREKKAFLGGYLDRKGGAYIRKDGLKPVIVLSYSSEELTYDLSLLLAEVGIYARYSVNTGEIEISTKQDIRKVIKLVRTRTRKCELETIIDNCPREEEEELNMDQCIQIAEYKRKHPKSDVRIIYRKIGLDMAPSRTVTQTITIKVKRYRHLQQLKQQRPDYNAIGYCYRTCGVSSRAARALASVYRLDNLKEYKPEDIQRWAERYDADNSVEIKLERDVIPLRVESELQFLAGEVAAKIKSPKQADERIKRLSRELSIPQERLDEVYFPAYRTALIKQDKNIAGNPSSQPIILGLFL